MEKQISGNLNGAIIAGGVAGFVFVDGPTATGGCLRQSLTEFKAETRSMSLTTVT